VFSGSSTSARFNSGLMTGFICVLLLTPLDTLRTNLVTIRESRKLWRDIPVLMKIVKPYQGLTPALLMYSPATAGLYTIYYMVQQKTDKVSAGFAGFIAGTLIKLIIHPLDVVKKRMQVSRSQIGLKNTIKSIYQREGSRAFYKAGAVSVFKSGLGQAVRFSVLEYVLKLQIQS